MSPEPTRREVDLNRIRARVGDEAFKCWKMVESQRNDLLREALSAVEPPDDISPDTAKMLFLALNYLVACVRNPGEDVFQSGAVESADMALAAARGKEISQE